MELCGDLEGWDGVVRRREFRKRGGILGFCFSAASFFFFSIIFGNGARLYSYNLLILMSAAFSPLAQSQLKTHCDQSHEAKPCHLDFNGILLSVVDLQKQC